ncbi:MAG: GNAT family N-acetyltransferase [Planctomycetaceae bacterium]|jgi:putative acetyltransferase|nr:GNAT family N-acetyltransferase [Planctomycetaceae bacterium]
MGISDDKMVIAMQKISTVSKKEYDQIIEIWELSVKATHDFLLKEDFDYYRQMIKNKYLDNLQLYAVRNHVDKILGFMGVSENKIEMLFVHPKEMRKGIGNSLLDYAVNKLNIKKVDVNEQNKDALQFYNKRGFAVYERTTKDNEGKNYPILKMQLK